MSDKPRELTIRSCLIGVLLAILLCGANTYLGLKLGTTISASIPAAIISMGILRMLKKYSILENNISQTIASAGEGSAAIIIFVFPALLILGTWKDFDYFTIFLIALCGGIIGIIFSVILRRALLNDKTLTFPEGQAIANVLLASNNAGTTLKTLLSGIFISGIFNFCQSGLQIFASGYQKFIAYRSGVIGTGIGFSPAAMGAGYLIGVNNGIVIILSTALCWFILLPIISISHGLNTSLDLSTNAFSIWKEYIRPIGIGVFIFSGVSTILFLLKPIYRGIRESVAAIAHLSDNKNTTEIDLNIKKLLILLVITCIPVTIFIFVQLTRLTNFSSIVNLPISIGLMLLVLILGFIIASVAGYFAGLVGSSNSPVSALLFIGVITLALSFLLIIRSLVSVNTSIIFSIIVTMVGFIGFSSAITGENIQDYKSGQLIGATPYKQQLSLFLGVFFAALCGPLFIDLIFHAYGIAGIAPGPGIDPNTTLSAPQAAGIAMLIQNIIGHSQNWDLLLYGIILGCIGLIIDQIGSRTKKFRFPVISIGIGLYIPPSLTIAIFAGSLLKYLVQRKHKKLAGTVSAEQISSMDAITNLFICGLIAGESLIGLFLAVPFVLKQSSDALKIVGDSFAPTATILGTIVICGIYLYAYRLSFKKTN